MNSLFSDLYRAIVSVLFFLAVLVQFLVLQYSGDDSELYRMSIPLVCTFPFSCAWLDESRGGFTRLALYRTSVFWYIVGKFTACAVSGGLAEWLASFVYHKVQDQPLPENAALLFFCGAFWAGISALLAAATGSKYAAYGGAFVVCYFLVILHERYVPHCQYLNPFEWLSPQSVWMFGQSGVQIMLGSLTVLTGLLYALILERRISHG